ncbi:Fpg/Nei family DNA glycosylase [Nesterenkonia alkaliphila]|uniref:Fpg/Nei family DNA glycosylase n=1 Tax=Nesterenkonia alkaliphila TaxID=1463631 RepID=A0A7K1UF27_9MICC|nr:DNA-formamidopyrimidine glycosylase family protein [Nesterenkonia alkaliphila]MVT25032.1 Fpg/Nei family DNA glycosylase [Nesterenkonia alkaliphila]GFZ97946.1 formamidopyrimidine-DNA glycosylase [Nesterenkonia alkaliphila]
MPELPEVHALAIDLESRLKGRVVQRLDVLAFYALKTFDPPVTALAGQVVQRVDRHGKFLDLLIGGLHLTIHLSLAGWIRWRDKAPAGMPSRKSPIAARLVLEGGTGLDITEAGTHKGLALHIVRNPSEVPGIAQLGPDALEIDEAGFAEILQAAGRAQLKGVLRKQSIIAGIGNAYSDEILHAAKMSPFRPANMGAEDTARLYAAMRQTLQEAIARAEGQPASELKKEKKTALRVHGRFGEPCPECGETIKQVVYSGSSFQYCPACQNEGKTFSDRGIDRLL